MAISSSTITNSQVLQRQANQPTADTMLGVVYDIVLNESNSNIQQSEDFKSKFIGAIWFRMAHETVNNDSKLYIAYPKSNNFKSIPVKNEYVSISKGNIGNFVYERTGTEITPNVNGDVTAINTNYTNDKKADVNSGRTYGNVFSTGIVRTNQPDNNYSSYGDYFEKQDGIHRLRLYEGDTLIESRFGQSIRFSAYNNNQNSYAPSIIIRNYENQDNRDLDFNNSILEDVNRDGSIIVLGSNNYQLDFKPGVVNDRGVTDFETKPNSFRDYPNQLIGHQVLLNSGRVIISAKSGELIFYSKKNYGFISDGGLSIDNRLGIDVNVGGDVNVTTNNRNVTINTGNGKIQLGSKDIEPMVKGDTLIGLLTELVDAITQQVYLTPAGSTSVGPTNIAIFQKIKSQLRTALSNLNSTS